MNELNNKNSSNDNLNISDYYIESNFNKVPFIIGEVNKKHNLNLNDSNTFINPVSLNRTKTQNNLIYNHLNLNKSNKNDECHVLNQGNNNNSKLKKIIYHRKSINNCCSINKNDKNKDNKNIIYNYKKKNYNDLTLSEYLKEEIKNMKYNHNYDSDNIYTNINNNNSEETKVNTLDINNNIIINEAPYSYRNMIKKNINNYNKISLNQNNNINNYLLRDTKKYTTYNSYLNKYNKINYKEEEKTLNDKKLLSSNIKNIKNGKVKNINKSMSKLNKKNLIKKIEFISFNNNNKKSNITTYRKNKQKIINNNSNKILNISFNTNKKENLLLFDKGNNCKYFLKKNIMKKNILDKKMNKKINSFNKSINDIKQNNNDKPLFCVKIDLEKLMNETNSNNGKKNKKYRFSKSTKRISYKNININDFAKDFFIIPKKSKIN